MNIIFLGPPGSGKGTQSKNIEKKYNIVQLSTGEMLRDVAKSENKMGRMVSDIMNKGQLISDEIMTQLIFQKISRIRNGFILDGFPRTLYQAEYLDKMFKTIGKKIDHVIEIRVDKDSLIKRIVGRYTCNNCCRGYHDIFHQPRFTNICDYCRGNQFNRRSDDNQKNAILRLKSYFEKTAPLIPYYRKTGKLRVIDGSLDIESITQNIENIIG